MLLQGFARGWEVLCESLLMVPALIAGPAVGDAAFPSPVSPAQLTFAWCMLAALQSKFPHVLSPW